MLTKLLIIIEYSDLVLMIISSFIRDELIAIVIRNELSRFISIRGTFIFDIKIIEAFIDGLDVDETMGSIIYKRGYDAIDTLINVKQYFDGDVIDALNEEGFSLMEIGDFMDELISQITEQELTDDVDIETLITSQIDLIFPKLEQQEQIRQQIYIPPPLLTQDTRTLITAGTAGVGGKNNRIYNPKHNTKYRKNYKKFVSKYIIKKKRNKNKNNKNNKNNNKKNNKNKTRKNKRLTKSTSNSKRNSKTLKNKKGKSKSKSKSGNHKSKYNNKTKTNYYNYYKNNKTLKH